MVRKDPSTSASSLLPGPIDSTLILLPPNDDHPFLSLKMSTVPVPPIDKTDEPVIPDAAPSEPTPTFIPAPTTQNVVQADERSVRSPFPLLLLMQLPNHILSNLYADRPSCLVLTL